MSAPPVIIRRYGDAMADGALAACRADIETGTRAQLARDVGDLLDEVDHLRTLVRILGQRP